LERGGAPSSLFISKLLILFVNGGCIGGGLAGALFNLNAGNFKKKLGLLLRIGGEGLSPTLVVGLLTLSVDHLFC
jgi:hypothetical protein